MEQSDLFAAIVEHSDAAIISKNLDGQVLSWNCAAEQIFGWTAEEMIGKPLRRIIPADRQAEEDHILDQIKRGESVTRMETVRLRKDGSEVPIAVLISPVRDPTGTVIGASKIARDITEELKTRSALTTIENRFGMMADNISQLAWISDAQGEILWLNRRWLDYTGSTEAASLGGGWQSFVHPDQLAGVGERMRPALEHGEKWEDTFQVRGSDDHYRWFLCRAVPQIDPAGTVLHWFGTATDVTDLRDAERRIELLLMEVNHRSRNLLSVVQSMARRTAASSEDFIPRLERRIAALASNQDVLVQRSWTAIPLRELIGAQLLFLEQAERQTELSGDDLVVKPTTAEALSMTFHELATNAEKYGAYSAPAGMVRISWDISGTGSDAEFVLRWTEGGGPKVEQTNEPGFGSRIMHEVPSGRLRGQVETEYAPQGFRFTLRCPAVNVLAVAE